MFITCVKPGFNFQAPFFEELFLKKRWTDHRPQSTLFLPGVRVIPNLPAPMNMVGFGIRAPVSPLQRGVGCVFFFSWTADRGLWTNPGMRDCFPVCRQAWKGVRGPKPWVTQSFIEGCGVGQCRPMRKKDFHFYPSRKCRAAGDIQKIKPQRGAIYQHRVQPCDSVTPASFPSPARAQHLYNKISRPCRAYNTTTFFDPRACTLG